MTRKTVGYDRFGREWERTYPDPVGAVEIAARLGVKRRTVDQWRQRALGFPEPRWTVGGRPAWNWDDVESWQAERKATLRAMGKNLMARGS